MRLKPKGAKILKLSIVGGYIMLFGLSGCNNIAVQNIKPDLLEPEVRYFLYEVAERTWQYLVFSAGLKGIPVDHAIIKKDQKLHKADYTSITNVGLFLMALPAAVDFGFLPPGEGDKRLGKIIAFLEAMPKSEGGLFYNYFKLKNGQPDEKLYVSSVDNAWLAAGLIIASKTENADLKERALKLYEEMDFSRFYDSKIGQLRLGYNDKDNKESSYHYGVLCTEARVLSMIALAKGQVPDKHWYKLYRTLPQNWTWQSQEPKGELYDISGNKVFGGYYEVDGLKVVPSWGGSLFEYLMPLLVVPELEIAKNSFGLNNIRVVKLHKEYCLQEAGYPVWGLSPSSFPAKSGEFKYSEFGYEKLGMKGYPDKGIITPHASILALEVDTLAVVENLQTMKEKFPAIWTEYGFYDSLNVNTGEVAKLYLALDQGMIFLALHNYLKDGNTRKNFFVGEIKEKMAPILAQEKFY